jgi:hypothetical protein
MARPKKQLRQRKPKPLTEGESLQLLATITRMINAWEKHAPNKKFGGMTVDDFRKATQPSFDAHAKVSQLEWELERLKRTLEEEDSEPPRRN